MTKHEDGSVTFTAEEWRVLDFMAGILVDFIYDLPISIHDVMGSWEERMDFDHGLNVLAGIPFDEAEWKEEHEVEEDEYE